MPGKTRAYGKGPSSAAQADSPGAAGAGNVRLDTAAIGTRIKMSREALGLTQDELARLAGSPSKSGLQSNEYGRTMPGGQMIGTLVRAGINANWLLTGDGPMLLSELGGQAAWRAQAEQAQAGRDALAARLERLQSVPLNEAAMRAIITGVLEAHRGRDAAPDYLARRAVELYCKALDEALITPAGVGAGKNEVA